MIDFSKLGYLAPVVVQDYKTKEVLMLAFMNQEALKLTLKTKIAHYYSRSKKRIWKKGESSENTQEIKEIFYDCDNDTLLLKVKQNGVACHTGAMSCFFNKVVNFEKELNDIEQNATKTNMNNVYIFDELLESIKSKKNVDITKSYSSKLLNDKNLRLKKLIEEVGEFVIASKDNNKRECIKEGSDIMYHFLCSLVGDDIDIEDIRYELKNRFGIGGLIEKASRKK
jgi:phosphoribosyl-ATP pyrophosphohydrolase/phosphoribosyl-AMP cyclohydrolase